jgi:hypothetical protein
MRLRCQQPWAQVEEPLPRSEMPAAYRATDEASTTGRDDTFRWTAAYLVLLTGAAVGSAVQWRPGGVDIGGWAATAFFAAALATGLANASRRPEQRWYQGRAGAESVKTLTWRYAVGGEPFGFDSKDPDKLFADRLRAVVDRLQHIQLTPDAGVQISDKMREMRAESLDTRKSLYRTGRIEDQQDWYARRAREHDCKGGRLAILVAVASAVGLIAGVLRATGQLDYDVMGIMAASGAALTAIAELKQHRTNASAYALAAQELSLAAILLENITKDDAWAQFVSDTEDAISRGHTMWMARHGRTAQER